MPSLKLESHQRSKPNTPYVERYGFPTSPFCIAMSVHHSGSQLTTDQARSNSHLNLMSISPANSDPDLDPEKTAVDSGNKLVLSEEESRTHIDNHPEDKTPLFVCFARDDKDNPRNFPAGKKWYITITAAWLNVVLSMAVSRYVLYPISLSSCSM